MRLHVLTALLLLMSPVAFAQSSGRAVLEISGASFRPVPLAVSPCSGDGVTCQVLDETLRRDFALCGLFDLLNPASFLDKAHDQLSSPLIPFDKWTAVGADGLVRMVVSDAPGGAHKIDFRLFLTATRREAVSVSTIGRGEGGLRAAAHDFADRVYREFTGDPGIFRTRIAYVRRTAGGKELVVSDLDGRNDVQLTGDGKLNLLPGWSPDGRDLFFTSYRTGAPMLHVMSLASRGVRRVGPEGDLQTGAAVSPDGKQVAFTMSRGGSANIWVMNRDGGNLRNLTNRHELDTSPSWSPDGKRIAFVSRRAGDPQVYMMNADGSSVDRLTTQGKYNQTPDWSPRGDLIAFTARDERNAFDIFTVEPSTRKIRRLTQGVGNNEEPSFSPNGRHIVFTSTRDGGRPRLYLMNLDGSNQRALGFGEATTPAWGPAAQ